MPMTTVAEHEVQQDTLKYASYVLTGAGEQVRRMRLQISRIAPHFRTVLVTGEAGTGKEAIARELHRLSGEQNKREPFVTADISGFAKGAVAFETRGILFLQGLDQLDPALQEGLVERLRPIQRQMKLVVSSECELRSLMVTARLRQDLASRIGGLEIRTSPLRDRTEDLAALVKAMLLGLKSKAYLSAEALRVMSMHEWPGNLAELWGTVAQVGWTDGEIDADLLPEFAPAMPADESGARLDRVMQRHVFEVLQRCSGNKLRTAEVLGISRSTLYRMLDAAVG